MAPKRKLIVVCAVLACFMYLNRLITNEDDVMLEQLGDQTRQGPSIALEAGGHQTAMNVENIASDVENMHRAKVQTEQLPTDAPLPQPGKKSWAGEPNVDFLRLSPEKYSPNEFLENCPNDAFFIWKLRHFSPPNKNYVVVDVGSNKGYSMTNMMWSLGVGNGKQDGHNLLKAIQDETNALIQSRHYQADKEMCGACGDCHFRPPGEWNLAAEPPVGAVRLYGFEGQPDLASFTARYFQGIPNVIVNITNAAVSGEDGTVFFCASKRSFGLFGDELGQITPKESDCDTTRFNVIHLRQVALDNFFRNSDVDVIDLLLTDTEGSDYILAQGAKDLFTAGRVRLYIFEMHGLGLGAHARFMWSVGYQCFFIIKQPARRFFHCMNGPCWHDWMEGERGWINAICVLRKETQLLTWMMSNSLPPEGKPPEFVFVG